MLFKYPQLLWSLSLLLIPILVHLLQLRRFKTTPFTNVRLLKRVQAKSQKSQSLKKWLLLLTRMALFTALILAFAQPFSAKKTAFKKQELVVFLDNSFSMQARIGQSTLLEEATQELINSIPEGVVFSLFTNNSEYRDVTMGEIRNSLLQPGFSSNQLKLEEIGLKGNSYFSADPDVLQRLVVLSDFQDSMGEDFNSGSANTETFYVPMRADELLNISIDTVFFDSTTGAENNLVIRISGNADFESAPVSLFNRGALIAKSAATYTEGESSELVFTLPDGEEIDGLVSVSDAGLVYDNAMYFNISTREKIRVLSIGRGGDFLSRLFGDDMTEYRSVESAEQARPLLPDQDFVILNQINTLSAEDSEALRAFVDLGGSLLLIPSMEMETAEFNRLLNPFGLILGQKNALPLEITGINYAHPLFKDVFKSQVKNFQYPSIREYFAVNATAEKILSFSNEEAFLANRGKVYAFSASLDPDNTNFTSSPLVVPTLYAMAVRSRSLPVLYYLLGTDHSVDVPVQLGDDRILSLKKGELEFIPRQQAVGRKTRLWFEGNPPVAGTFELENAPISRAFSFNEPRTESELTFLDPDAMETGAKVVSSVEDLFAEIEKDNTVTGLWKWFAIFALLMLLAEVIIQKVLK